jgi:hypothetical protein
LPRFQYSYVCSSMMSVHPKGGGSMRDTRVSLINVARCGPISWFAEVGGRW